MSRIRTVTKVMRGASVLSFVVLVGGLLYALQLPGYRHSRLVLLAVVGALGAVAVGGVVTRRPTITVPLATLGLFSGFLGSISLVVVPVSLLLLVAGWSEYALSRAEATASAA